jgi:primosomal protein N' (replication factor Y)
MAIVKPLRLKVQKAPGKNIVSADSGVAKVLVDSGVFHLSASYDYLVPAELDATAQPGTLVEVPFGSKNCQGYILSRHQESSITGKLKFIAKVLSPIPSFNEEMHQLLTDVAKFFACGIWEIIRSAIPPRVAKVENEFAGRSPLESTPKQIRSGSACVLKVAADDLVKLILESEQLVLQGSQILVIVPDEREVEFLRSSLKNLRTALFLTSQLEKSDRYRNFLSALFDIPRLIIGTRSAIFTPLQNGSRIIIFSDGDESMYEKRAPGWNVRDVALLRAKTNEVIFMAASPSLEVALLDAQVIDVSAPRRIFHFEGSRKSDLAIVKDGLKKGSVLVVLPQPGYVNTFSCQKCRNIAICECGGRLEVTSAKNPPICVLCAKGYSNWTCTYCHGDVKRIVMKGSDRYAEELTKAVPGYQVLISKGSSRIDVLPVSSTNPLLVIATYGCEPIGDYQALVLHSLENLTNRTNLRSSEEARTRIFDDISLVVPGGEIHLSLTPDHPISRSLMSDLAKAPYVLAKAEILERRAANLPPSCLMACVGGSSTEISQLARQIEDIDTFSSVVVLPDKSTAQSAAKLIARSNGDNQLVFSKFFEDLARYRSLKGLRPFNIRIQPYSI